ncbi:MAG: methyl-accepting chemotaxis protein [Treponema sp.]|nr:methyl-accepting chemotaxis protein [Treponema sp.]
MSKVSLISLLMPNEECQQKLTFKALTQLRFLIASNFIIILTLVTFALIELLIGNTIIGILSMLCSLLNFLALFLIKRGRISLGAGVTTTSLLIADFVICFLGTAKYDDSNIVYRNIYFITVMAVLNFLMSVTFRQMLIYVIVSFTMFVSSFFTVCGKMIAADSKGFIIAVVITTVSYLMVVLSLLFSTRNTDSLIAKFKKEFEKSVENIGKIKKVVAESETGLKIGDELKSAATAATSNSQIISDAFAEFLPKIESLTKDLGSIENQIREIEDDAGKMEKSSNEQAFSVQSTSSAMVEISTNVTTISDTAQKRKAKLNKVVEGIDQQQNLAKSLAEQLGKVEEYSAVINGFVKTINNVAEQTNLLAMNASIEAAHAGKVGTGFSVIAQEIRKLSSETAINARNIEEVLKQNTDVVKSTVDTMRVFNRFVSESSVATTDTLNSMDEIISGIMEIDVSTKDIMSSITNLAEGSKESVQIVNNVTNKIEAQVKPVGDVVNFITDLRAEINILNQQIEQIETILNKISSDSQVNAEVGKRILESLSNI